MNKDTKITIKTLKKLNVPYKVHENGDVTATGKIYLQGYKQDFYAPKLKEAGHIRLRYYKHNFYAPKLKEAETIDLLGYEHDFIAPKLTKAKNIYLLGYKQDFNAPNLTKAGYIDLRCYEYDFNAPNLTDAGNIRFNGKLFNKEFEVFDGSGTVILSKKIVGDITINKCTAASMVDGEFNGEVFYVASNNNHNAHGETVKEAILELEFKSKKRDVTQYRKATNVFCFHKLKDRLIKLITKRKLKK